MKRKSGIKCDACQEELLVGEASYAWNGKKFCLGCYGQLMKRIYTRIQEEAEKDERRNL